MPRHGTTPDFPETQFQSRSDDSQTLYAAKCILDERGPPGNKGRYLVQWAGTDPSTGKTWDPTWEPKSGCSDDLIAEWKENKRNNPDIVGRKGKELEEEQKRLRKRKRGSNVGLKRQSSTKVKNEPDEKPTREDSVISLLSNAHAPNVPSSKSPSISIVPPNDLPQRTTRARARAPSVIASPGREAGSSNLSRSGSAASAMAEKRKRRRVEVEIPKSRRSSGIRELMLRNGEEIQEDELVAVTITDEINPVMAVVPSEGVSEELEVKEEGDHHSGLPNQVTPDESPRPATPPRTRNRPDPPPMASPRSSPRNKVPVSKVNSATHKPNISLSNVASRSGPVPTSANLGPVPQPSPTAFRPFLPGASRSTTERSLPISQLDPIGDFSSPLRGTQGRAGVQLGADHSAADGEEMVQKVVIMTVGGEEVLMAVEDSQLESRALRGQEDVVEDVPTGHEIPDVRPENGPRLTTRVVDGEEVIEAECQEGVIAEAAHPRQEEEAQAVETAQVVHPTASEDTTLGKETFDADGGSFQEEADEQSVEAEVILGAESSARHDSDEDLEYLDTPRVGGHPDHREHIPDKDDDSREARMAQEQYHEDRMVFVEKDAQIAALTAQLTERDVRLADLADQSERGVALESQIRDQQRMISNLEGDLSFIRDQYTKASDRAVEEVQRGQTLQGKVAVLESQLQLGLKQRDLHFAAIKAKRTDEVEKMRKINAVLMNQARLTDDRIRSKAAQYGKLKSDNDRLRGENYGLLDEIAKLQARNNTLAEQISVIRAHKMGAFGDDSDDEGPMRPRRRGTIGEGTESEAETETTSDSDEVDRAGASAHYASSPVEWRRNPAEWGYSTRPLGVTSSGSHESPARSVPAGAGSQSMGTPHRGEVIGEEVVTDGGYWCDWRDPERCPLIFDDKEILRAHIREHVPVADE